MKSLFISSVGSALVVCDRSLGGVYNEFGQKGNAVRTVADPTSYLFFFQKFEGKTAIAVMKYNRTN